MFASLDSDKRHTGILSTFILLQEKTPEKETVAFDTVKLFLYSKTCFVINVLV